MWTMTITIPENGEIDIESFKKLLDISKVEWYSLEEKDGVIILKFYDKNRKVLKFYANINKKTKKARSKKKQAKS